MSKWDKLLARICGLSRDLRFDELRKVLELGVDDLITDKPDMVQDLLARNQQVDDSLIDFRDLLNALLHPEHPADSSDDAEETITDAVEDPEEFVDAA